MTLTITLNAEVRLELDEAEAVKIQGYDDAPYGNPSPGFFTTYQGSSLTITVPEFTFYGIHLDVEIEVCPID